MATSTTAPSKASTLAWTRATITPTPSPAPSKYLAPSISKRPSAPWMSCTASSPKSPMKKSSKPKFSSAATALVASPPGRRHHRRPTAIAGRNGTIQAPQRTRRLHPYRPRLKSTPDATVYYHTGIQTKNAKQPAAEPTWGQRSNKPIQVADNMQSILAALGMAQDTLDKTKARRDTSKRQQRICRFVEY